MTNLDLYVTFDSHLIEETPMLITEFNLSKFRSDTFDTAKAEIEITSSFTSKQVSDFKTILDFLIKSDLPLTKYSNVNIYTSTFEGMTFFIKIKNTNLEGDGKYDICFNYKPEVFIGTVSSTSSTSTGATSSGSSSSSSYRSIGSRLKSFFTPCYITTVTGTNSRTSTTNTTIKRKITFTTFLTIANCFLYAGLYLFTHHRNYIHDHPFRSAFVIVFDGIIYTIPMDIVSHICPPYSSIVFNGVLGYVNYRMLMNL